MWSHREATTVKDDKECVLNILLTFFFSFFFFSHCSDGKLKPPTVYILSPSLEQLNLREKVTISCLIQDFSPGSFFVRWLHNEEPISESEYFTSQPIAESKVLSKQYFAYSLLTVSEQEWSAGDSYTCMVGHEALPYNTIQKTVNKNTGKPSIVNVSLVLSDASSPCY